MQDTQDDNLLDQQTVNTDNERVVDKEKLEESFKNRLKVERQKAEAEAKKAQELSKKLDELQRKFESGKATSQQSSDAVTAENVQQEAKMQGIPHEALPGIIEEHLQIKKLEASLTDAVEKDPELKSLVNAPDAQSKISPEEFMLLKHLDNAPQVLKHLLKDDRDRATLKAAERSWGNGDGGYAFMQFVNNLSKQLDKTSNYPKPPSYTPAAELDNIGSSDDFETGSYISGKYN